MGALITMKDLRVFRGTYAEIKERPTEDKMIYLAWDTQELFVGNARGVKVKYGGVKNLDNLLVEAFEKFRGDVYQTIDSYASSKVEGILAQTVSDINERISSGLSSLQSSEDAKIEGLSGSITALSSATDTRINALTSDLNSLHVRLADITTSLQGLSNRVNTVDEDIISTRNAVRSNASEILDIRSQLDSLSREVADLSASIGLSPVNTVVYKTGEELAEMVSALTESDMLETFVPTLCISSYGDYMAGSIYYYNGSGIVPTGVGGGGTIEHAAAISAEFVNLESRYPANSGSKTGKVMITVSGDETAISSYKVSLLKDGVQVPGYESLTNGQSISLSTASAGIYTLAISAVATPNTSTHTYTVSTSVGEGITVYVQLVTNVRFVSNYAVTDYDYIGTYKNIPIEAEKTLLVYSTQPLTHIIFNGGLEDEELDFTQETSDLESYQYKYNLGNDWYDTNLPSITLS